MRFVFVLAAGWVASFCSHAQVYMANKSSIVFFSDAAIEDIKGENSKVESALDLGSGAIEFRVTMKEFVFDKSLMRQHFNEKYVHSEKYPVATFRGTITGMPPASGTQPVTATGKMMLHGITRDVSVAGTLEFQPGSARVSARFMIRLEDYDIPRPQILWKNIAEEVEVTVDITYKAQ
jgi:hypothetical protein